MPQVLDEVRDVYEGLCQSVVVEQANQKQRGPEYRDNDNKNICRIRRWHVVVHSSLVRSYNRKEIDVGSSSGTSARRQLVPKTTFIGAKMKSFQPSIDVAKVSGRRSWLTHTPKNAHEQTAKLMILMHLHDVGWNRGSMLWKAACFLANEIYQLKIRGHGNVVYFVLGHVGQCVLLWPVTAARAAGSTVYTLQNTYCDANIDHEVKPVLQCITDVQSWEGIPTEIISPLAAQVAHGKSKPPLPPGILLRQNAPAHSLFKHAAKGGFRGVSEPNLRKIAEEEGVDVPIGHIPCAVVLIRHFLKPITDAEILAILQTTFRNFDTASDLLEGEDIDAILPPKDKSEAAQDAQRREEKAEECQIMQQEVESWFAEQSQNAKKPRTGPTSRAGASSGSASSARKRWVAPEQDALVSREEAQSMGPETAAFSIGRTPGQGRWFAAYKGHDPGYKSYSWKLWGGEGECIRLCLKWAWEEHEKEIKRPCTGSDCPVDGIFL